MPTWIITGANRGLGLEFTTQLSSDPSNTVISTVRSLSRDHHALASLQSSHPKNLHVLECDTSSQSSIQAFGHQVSSLLGKDAHVDFLLNNAGINATPRLSSLSMTPEAFSEHMNVNVMGPAKMVQVFTQNGMLGKGSVVMNMTSGLGSLAYNRTKEMAECTVYSLSKAAVNMLSVHQASQLRERGVVVVCVDPGWVKTDMGGKNAVLEKETSIGGMVKLLKGLKMEHSGRFWVYDGSEKAW